MSLTAFLIPPLPVLLGLVIALPVLLLVAFFSRKIAANLNEKQEAPSAAEVTLYGIHNVCKLLVAPLATYVLYAGGFWLLMNASAGFWHTFGQIGRVVVVVFFAASLALSVVAASVSVGLHSIEGDGTELENAGNNREHKALQAIDKALPPAWVCAGITLALFPTLLVMVVVL